MADERRLGETDASEIKKQREENERLLAMFN
jgi:hypothetical protein